MRILWRVQLPQPIGGFAGVARAPLHWDGDELWLPTKEFKHAREERARDPDRRGTRARVFRFGADGRFEARGFDVGRIQISSSWSFLELGARLVLHVGVFLDMPGGEPIRTLAPVSAGLGPGRLIHRIHGDCFVYVHPGQSCAVHCNDLATLESRWSVSYENTQFGAAPVLFAHDRVFCFARDAASSIDLATGEIVEQWTLPRIGKLYPPIEYDGDLLFPYGNRRSGGLLRFDPVRERVKWKCSQRTVPDFWNGPLTVVGRVGVLSLNEGQVLVGIDLESGDELWRFRAGLSTEIEVRGDSILFGTGRMAGHHLRRHDVTTGETEWQVALEYGCEGFLSVGDDLIVGDWKGVLRRVRSKDGEVVDAIRVGGPIPGPFARSGGLLFALCLGKQDDEPYSIIAIEL